MALVNKALSSLGASITADLPNPAGSHVNVIDGVEGTYCTQQFMAVGKWYVIVLAQAELVSAIRFDQHPDAGNQASSYDIEYSSDGTTWTTLQRKTVEASDETFNITPTLARYWRFTCVTAPGFYWAQDNIELLVDDEPTIGPGGCTFPPEPTEEELEGWLWYVETYYVPTVAAWLAEN